VTKDFIPQSILQEPSLDPSHLVLFTALHWGDMVSGSGSGASDAYRRMNVGLAVVAATMLLTMAMIKMNDVLIDVVDCMKRMGHYHHIEGNLNFFS